MMIDLKSSVLYVLVDWRLSVAFFFFFFGLI